jgi:TPP-dependent indolepyruvate ferredoxin oxidoreductase alpha subunit
MEVIFEGKPKCTRCQSDVQLAAESIVPSNQGTGTILQTYMCIQCRSCVSILSYADREMKRMNDVDCSTKKGGGRYLVFSTYMVDSRGPADG